MKRPVRFLTVGLLVTCLPITVAQAKQTDTVRARFLPAAVTPLVARGTTSLLPPAPLGQSDIRTAADAQVTSPSIGDFLAAVGAPTPALIAPSPAGEPLALSNPGASGFPGLNHADQRNAGTGQYANTQFNTEPADPGLCVGNGFVLEGVDYALAVYARDGTPLSAPTPLNQFFNLAPQVNRANLTFGDYTGAPKCYYDPDTHRWFVTIFQADVNPSDGAFTGPSHVEIAVSQSDTPVLSWNLYSLDTTDDGTNSTPAHPGCPCLGEVPTIGANADGLFISTNEFSTFGPQYNGAQLYAIPKVALATAGSSPPVAFHFDNLSDSAGDNFSSVQPSTSPLGQEDRRAGGTEYFLSSIDPQGTFGNQLAVWAMTDTSSMNTPRPRLELDASVVQSEVYGKPPPAQQEPGPLPLGSTVNGPLETLQTDDDRMTGVVYADGLLWGALNTVLSGSRAGIAYFMILPSPCGACVNGMVIQQGYVSLDGEDVMYPAIAVNRSGQGVMGFTLSGPDYYPSAAYVGLTPASGAGPIHIAAAGVAPEDGFTGYPAFGGNGSARWGDNSAAAPDSDGSLWTATEYISGVRSQYANWATYLERVQP